MNLANGLLVLALVTTGGIAQAAPQNMSTADGTKLYVQQEPPTGGQQAGPRGQFGGPGGPGGFQMNPAMGHQMAVSAILHDPKVQEELGLKPDQIEKINEAFPAPRMAGPGGPGGPPNGGFGGGQGGGQRGQGGGQGQGGFGGGQGGGQRGQGGFGGDQGGGQGQGGGQRGQGGFGGGQGGGQGQGGFGGPPQGPPGGQGFGRPDPAQMEKQRIEVDAKVKGILNAKQFNRFKELEYQWVGAVAIGWKEVADELRLSEQQRQRVNEAMSPFGPRGPQQGGPGGPPNGGGQGQGGIGGGQGGVGGGQGGGQQGQGGGQRGQGGFGGGQGGGQQGQGGGQRGQGGFGGGQGQGGPPQGGPPFAGPQGQPDMMKERDAKILAILNAEQNSAWQKMQGKKFEFSRRPGMGGFGPRPGGPGGPPNGGGGGGGSIG